MFNYAWLIPLLPLLAFATIVLVANRRKDLSAKLAIGALFISFILAMGVLVTAIPQYHELAEEPFSRYVSWMPTGLATFRLGYTLDPLAVATLSMVSTGVSDECSVN